jgi:hypothetical protein
MKQTDARAILCNPAYYDRAAVRRAAIFLNAVDLAARPEQETLAARRILGRIADDTAYRTKTIGG